MDIDRPMTELLTTLDTLSLPAPQGLALRPGYALYRAEGAPLGTTRIGDRLVRAQAITRPSSVPRPATLAGDEWVSGTLYDGQGPVAEVVCLAAAVDPHSSPTRGRRLPHKET